MLISSKVSSGEKNYQYFFEYMVEIIIYLTCNYYFNYKINHYTLCFQKQAHL